MRDIRRRSVLAGVIGLLATLAVAGMRGQVEAQLRPDALPGRPIRIEGYWDRTRAEREIIGDVTISTDGRTRRTFGVTALQAYQPEEEGMQVLRHSTLSPVTLLLRGRKEMIDKLWSARSNENITVLGVYNPGSSTLVLNSVDVAKNERHEEDPAD